MPEIYEVMLDDFRTSASSWAAQSEELHAFTDDSAALRFRDRALSTGGYAAQVAAAGLASMASSVVGQFFLMSFYVFDVQHAYAKTL